jgi:magnesium-protoporphyrin O-methyltransferase
MSTSYLQRRREIEVYFDRTAVAAWARLTSNAPVSRIRATVRAGRDAMCATLLDWLPADLSGRRVLDAGCGTGALAVAAAQRGAAVVAVDLSPTLINLAAERAPRIAGGGSVMFISGDMLDAAFGDFDHIVCMDSLIHYRAADAVRALAGLRARATASVLFTFAPRTPLLAVMHGVGRLFPRGDRAPSIEPVAEAQLRRLIEGELAGSGWRIGRSHRVDAAFYKSQAMELTAA